MTLLDTLLRNPHHGLAIAECMKAARDARAAHQGLIAKVEPALQVIRQCDVDDPSSLVESIVTVLAWRARSCKDARCNHRHSFSHTCYMVSYIT